MWNTRKFEEQMQAKLRAQLSMERAEELFAIYQTTRTKLLENVYAEIKGAEPALSDHGPRHIENVLDNAYHLLEENGMITCLSGVELYVLGMMILFHDVGNLYGRINHHKKIAEIYDWARGTAASVRREKVLVISAARAHTGKAADGSYDTLKDVGPQEPLGSEKVRLQELAAILRFADELAEGPQRTSEFLREKGLYSGDSTIFHEYASITNVFIDRGTERVLLTYEIEVEPCEKDLAWSDRLRIIMEFVYTRVLKLDQERRYARYYSNLLNPFKATWVKFNFHCGGQVIDPCPVPLKLDDKVTPGDPVKAIPDFDASYNIDTLITKIVAQTGEVQE